MYKIIFDKTLGFIVGTCVPAQDHYVVMGIYTNVDFIELESLPHKDLLHRYRVNLTTRQLEEIS